jgi:hypothetical protein
MTPLASGPASAAILLCDVDLSLEQPPRKPKDELIAAVVAKYRNDLRVIVLFISKKCR